MKIWLTYQHPHPSQHPPPLLLSPPLDLNVWLQRISFVYRPPQLSSLSPSVTPKSISMDLYLQLSPEQMDVIPDFILVKDSPSKKPVAPPLRRTRSQNKDRK